MRYRHRRSVRLRDHEYGDGLYFITICSHGGQTLFGDVTEGEMVRAPFGDIAHDQWVQTPDKRPTVHLDAFVVMPDHVHLLFGIVPTGAAAASSRRGAARCADGSAAGEPAPERRFANVTPQTVPVIVRSYKSAVTRAIHLLGGPIVGPVWQRGYHDRVVRNEREAEAIRRYIAENPARWHAQDPNRRNGHRT